MDHSLIGTIWTNGQGKFFEITNLLIDNGNTIVYYRNTVDPTLSYNCFFEAFQHRFHRDFQGQNATIRKPKIGLII